MELENINLDINFRNMNKGVYVEFCIGDDVRNGDELDACRAMKPIYSSVVSIADPFSKT